MLGISWIRHSCLFFVITVVAQAPDHLATGIEQFHRGEYQSAQRSLGLALKANPDDPYALTFLFVTRAATGGCEAVREDLAGAFAKNKDADLRKLAGLALVQCQLSQNRLEEALPVVSKLEKEFPSDADVLYETAKVHMKAWNNVVYRMFQKTPASYRVNQISAEIFEVEGRYGEATREYRKAIEKNPAALNLHFRLGRALLLGSHSSEALGEARKQFEAELQLNSNDAVAEYEIGQILLTENQPASAAQHLERAVALSPDFPEALIALAKICSASKRYDDAILLLERATRLRPSSEAAHYNLMLAYRNAGRAEEAQREKKTLDTLQRQPQGEFTDFLKKLGEKAPNQ